MVAMLLLTTAVALAACRSDKEPTWKYADRFVSKVYINPSL